MWGQGLRMENFEGVAKVYTVQGGTEQVFFLMCEQGTLALPELQNQKVERQSWKFSSICHC